MTVRCVVVFTITAGLGVIVGMLKSSGSAQQTSSSNQSIDGSSPTADAINTYAEIDRPNPPPPMPSTAKQQEQLPGLAARSVAPDPGDVVIQTVATTQTVHLPVPEPAILDDSAPMADVPDQQPIDLAAGQNQDAPDIEKLLQQRIERFQLDTPTPLETVLSDISDLFSGKLRYASDVSSMDLQETVTIRLESTTVDELLKKLLEPTGLRSKIVDGAILISH